MRKDDYSYLEDAGDSRTQSWVRANNDRTLRVLQSDPRFQQFFTASLQANTTAADGVNNATATGLLLQDGWVHQLWLSAENPRGLWRRTPLKSFLSATPAWQPLVDVDALARQERKAWNFLEAKFSPGGRTCLIKLSDGGSNTYELREFDVSEGKFVAGGFKVPAGLAASASWKDDNTLLVSTDFGPGSLTVTGNPMVVKQWLRGQPLAAAMEVFRGRPDDFAVSIVSLEDRSAQSRRSPSRQTTISVVDKDQGLAWWQLDAAETYRRLPLPTAIGTVVLHSGYYIFKLKQPWLSAGRSWNAGELLAIPASSPLGSVPAPKLVLKPGEDESLLEQFMSTEDGLLVLGASLGSNFVVRVRDVEGAFVADRVPLPSQGLTRFWMSDADDVFVLHEDYLQPPALFRIDVRHKSAAIAKENGGKFASARFVSEKLEAVSADGTKVPYLVTHDRNLRADGSAAVLVDAYGAFGHSAFPMYMPTLGKLWLERGGVHVLAHIRGGRERGDAWHVRGADRQHTYEDLIAVAEDLVRRRITEPKRIGIRGTSAGGLLAGVVINERPDLFGAAVLQVPLLDQFRVDLVMGTAEINYAEFGSPLEARGREFLERTSPFQNLSHRGNFPMPLILTASNDQNVFPAQPRRYAARMQDLELPYLFFEAAEGGHGVAKGSGEAQRDALVFTYLTRQLMDPQPDRVSTTLR